MARAAPTGQLRRVWRLLAALTVALLLFQGAAADPQQAATAWTPFFTAIVNLTSVPAYRGPAGPNTTAAAGVDAASSAVRAAAAAYRRAAGYPVSAAYSRPPLRRDFGLEGAGPRLQGPAALPAMPEIARRRSRSRRRRRRGLLQADGAAPAAAAPLAAHAGACRSGAGCFAPRGGFPGLDAPPTGTMGLAVGRRQLLQVAGDVMAVYNLGATGTRSTTARTVSLSAFFAAVAPSCAGVHDAAAAYDKQADRFVVAAACGGFGRLLLGVSATPDAAGGWFLFGLVADAVGTRLECTAPKEQALADYPQIGYNADGLFLTYHSSCPSSPSRSGAVLLSLPKYKAYQGAPSMYYSVHTAAEVAEAAGLPGGAAAVRQLQPAVPQSGGDAAEGVAYFVAEHVPPPGQPRDSFTVVALLNTGALWGYAGGLNGVPTPALLAAPVPWGRPAPLLAGAALSQPGGGGELAAGGPAGFWSGGAALSQGALLLSARADAPAPPASTGPARPGVIWAEVSPRVIWRANADGDFGRAGPFSVPAAECPSDLRSGMAARFDWAKDYSQTWGSNFGLRNWSAALGAFREASSRPPAAPAPAQQSGATRAAAVVLDRAKRLESAAAVSPAANFLNMGLPQGPHAAAGGRPAGPMGGSGYRGRGGGCGCESSCGFSSLQTYQYVYNFDDYCDAGSNQWGPSNGNDMFGTTYNGAYCTGDATFGVVGNQQYDQCSRWCAIRCPGSSGGVEGYTAPNYGFYGATNNYPQLWYASIDPLPSNASDARAPASDGAATAPTRPMRAAACAAAAALAAEVVRSGALEADGALGLAFPSAAVAPNGAAVIAAAFSGPGTTPDGRSEAFPGVTAAFVDAAALGVVPISILARGSAPVVASGAVPGTSGGSASGGSGSGASASPGYWGELAASDVHPVTGAVYVAARRGGATRTGHGTVATWVAHIPLAAAAA
ncbi:hypothetical protein Rsub_10145 [Raphidocelis subcapitata]|uniref:Uncharacterized protein n=1 Tax=Raphidocelis subcapitata TaxID=307507 RepID=A0A2V0PCG3_9CHLO|nr:hypothetical protein Rsub_10145 [Raphidocelis subcapitata]|eukprot:GBF97544.1 hypothetical protein Rsub_10145 [Raphidocelis subcapitata]